MIVANTQVTDCASRSSPAHINRKSLTPLARIDLPAWLVFWQYLKYPQKTLQSALVKKRIEAAFSARTRPECSVNYDKCDLACVSWK